MTTDVWLQGICPACGSRGTLFAADGGYITCSLDVCTNPSAVADLLEYRIQPDRLNDFHTARITQHRWSLAHPLYCDLASCKYDAVAQLWPSPPRPPGEYAWHGLDDSPAVWVQR